MFRQAAVRNTKPSLRGLMLRFRKGDWIFGSEKQKIAPGTRFVGIMSEVQHGWLKWNPDRTPTHRRQSRRRVRAAATRRTRLSRRGAVAGLAFERQKRRPVEIR